MEIKASEEGSQETEVRSQSLVGYCKPPVACNQMPVGSLHKSTHANDYSVKTNKNASAH
ncbi:MAG: hypothetical protein NTY07_12035 [Bacteroidia bacterium]|nr:hypothetical protein [Bacteroidia bacterium]